jgi:MFS family permease
VLRRIAVDTRPLRESRDFRLLMIGAIVTGFGTQAALVALPYQLYVESHSAFLTGLLGLVELAPLVIAGLWGGATADRLDRRRMLLLVQVALVVIAAALAAVTFAGDPPLWVLYVLAAAAAGASSLERVTRAAIVPNTVAPERLRAAISFSYGMSQVTMVAGPAIGGLLIAGLGIASAYVLDGVSCLGMVFAALMMSPQLPKGAREHEPVLRSIRTGLGFVSRSQELLGSFAIDLCAMTFGMPRALFPVLSVSIFHAGAAGTGLLNAAVAIGATVAALTTRWLEHARSLGRITLAAVAVWGGGVAIAGVFSSIWLAALAFAVAGAADSVSAVCRATISQSLTPDHMRGRMSSVFTLVVSSGPRLGDVESGTVASVFTPRFSVVSGGLACIASVGVIAALFPRFVRYDADVAAPIEAAPEPAPA